MKVLALKRRSPLFPFLDLLTFLELLGEIVVLIQKGGWPGRDQTPEPEGIENQVCNESQGSLLIPKMEFFIKADI